MAIGLDAIGIDVEHGGVDFAAGWDHSLGKSCNSTIAASHERLSRCLLFFQFIISKFFNMPCINS
jgi:hypothetical protein